MPLWTWSRTSAGANGGADPGINFLENQAPSSLNDSARALMQATAQYRDDVAGGTVTTGASQAYSLTTFSNFTSAAALANQQVGFTPHVTNGATVTISIDSVANIPLRSSPGVELPAGVLIAGTPYVCTYNASDSALYLHGFYGANPALVPIGGLVDYVGATVPSSTWAIPNGQAISRTAYATLFALVGTTYGVGDGSTTFNVPDLTGRVSAMKEASATRLTSSWFGGNSTVLGATGFAEKNALSATNQLPQFTPAGSVALNCGGPGAIAVENGQSPTTESNGGGAGFNVYLAAVYASLTAAFTGTPVGSATPASFATGQPTIIVQKLLRVL